MERGRGAEGGVSSRRSEWKKKVSRYSLYIYIYIYKISRSLFQWFTSFKTNKRSNRQERDITPPMFYRIQSKVNQVILTLILNNSLNFRILAQAIL